MSSLRTGKVAAAAALVLGAGVRPAVATHVPPESELILYDGPLGPMSPVSGSIGWSSPVDGYDWYCFDGDAGVRIVVTATRQTGDIQLNLGLLQGVTNNGDPRSVLPQLFATANSMSPDVILNYTPLVTGPLTLWVSTWLGEMGGQYSLTMSGGKLRATCAPPPPACIEQVREVELLKAVKAGPGAGDVEMTWQADAAANGYNVWYVTAKADIPRARLSDIPPANGVGLCSTPAPAPGPTCTDVGAVPRGSPARFYYQVRAYCDPTHEGP